MRACGCESIACQGVAGCAAARSGMTGLGRAWAVNSRLRFRERAHPDAISITTGLWRVEPGQGTSRRGQPWQATGRQRRQASSVRGLVEGVDVPNSRQNKPTFRCPSALQGLCASKLLCYDAAARNFIRVAFLFFWKRFTPTPTMGVLKNASPVEAFFYLLNQ